jgi:hypothetical protein
MVVIRYAVRTNACRWAGIRRHKHATPSPGSPGFFTPGGDMQPITKHQQRIQADQRATSHYRRRPDIDRRLEEMRQAKQLKEVWQ